jgi:8-oxo-dGTP pyrophosphatase MutT (NUDIX family)
MSVNDELERFLARHRPEAEEQADWGVMQLRVTAYRGHELPPLPYLTSVRCIALRDGKALVAHDEKERVALPGGRREAGETIKATLRREMLEETGWAIGRPSQLGFMHFHHLTPPPPGYAYPYPDFLQVVFVADAVRHDPEATVYDQYVRGVSFLSRADLPGLALSPTVHFFVEAALARRVGS